MVRLRAHYLSLGLLAITLPALAACGDGDARLADTAPSDAGADGDIVTDTGLDVGIDSGVDGGAGVDGSTGVDGGAVCTEYERAEVLGNVETGALDEISGIAASRQNADVLWAHNDSGDSARVFALRTDGRHLGAYSLTGASARDWEDMTIGPGPTPGIDYLYLGDHGDNAARGGGVGRPSISVYRVAEPTVDRDQAPMGVDLTGVEELPFVYPAGAHDCEALMIDPATADLYLLTKENDGQSELYVVRAPIVADVERTLERVGAFTFGGAVPGSPEATGGDISPSGDAILVRTYASVLLFPIPEGGEPADAFLTAPLALESTFELQGEGIAWAPDGRGYFTISEGGRPPVNYFAPSASCAR